MVFGCFASGVLMERYGRRMTRLLFLIPFSCGWIVIGFANNLTWLLAGRVITGVAVSIIIPPGYVMIAEISDPKKYRGIFLATTGLGVATGILTSHVLGTYLVWRTTALICSLFPFINFLVLLTVPESPAWLLAKGRHEEGREAYQWYRGTSERAEIEFEDMLKKQQLRGKGSSFSHLGQQIQNPLFYKPLAIILIFFCISNFSGVNDVAFYSVRLMEQTLGSGGCLDKFMATILIDSVRLFMSFLACLLNGSFGRRGLALFSAIGTALSLFGLSAYLHLSEIAIIPSYPLIPLILLISFTSFICIGLMPLPWAMIGELFPLSSRGLGSVTASSFSFLCLFTVVHLSPSLFSSFGAAYGFLLYGSVAFLGAIYIFFYLPETRNRTLQEIEDYFKNSESKTVVVR